MIKMARNKKENKRHNPHSIFNQTINDLNITAIQFVVPWQMAEAGKQGNDAKQLDLNFRI